MDGAFHSMPEEQISGGTIWSKIRFILDFWNLLFTVDFDLSFSTKHSLMKIFDFEADFIAKWPFRWARELYAKNAAAILEGHFAVKLASKSNFFIRL